MHRRLVMPAIAALLAASCTGPGDEAVPVAPVDRLAVVDGAGNVVTMRPDGSDRVSITDDAGGGVVYFQPVWSPDAQRLAYSETRQGRFAMVLSSADGSGRTAFDTATLPFYFSWSPQGDQLAWLRNAGGRGLALEVTATDADPEASAAVFATGAPLYFSWSPEGDRMVGHIAGDRLDYLGGEVDPTSIGANPGAFQAPVWMADGSIAYVAAGETSLELATHEADGPQTVARVGGDALFFVVNSSGSHVALQGIGGEQPGATTAALQAVPEIPAGRLVVVDLATGDAETVSLTLVVAFFWSPLGDRLLVLDADPDGGALRWSQWEPGAELVRLGSFVPSPTFARDYLPFFDQYAQSTTLWSPDGARFAFPGRIGDRAGIWVHAFDGKGPTRVSEGDFVMWSPR